MEILFFDDSIPTTFLIFWNKYFLMVPLLNLFLPQKSNFRRVKILEGKIFHQNVVMISTSITKAQADIAVSFKNY